MIKRRYLFLTAGLLFLMLLAVQDVAAQTGTPIEVVWTAQYWNNTDLSGAPDLTRTETAIDHHWGQGSPDPVISSDRFSARWTTSTQVEEGRYRFTTVSDDGIRVWLNDSLIIDNWSVHPEMVDTVVTTLSAGTQEVRVEYFENTGEAIAILNWERLNQAVTQPTSPALVISPTSGPVGTAINVEATGLLPNAAVTVGIARPNMDPVSEKTVVTTADGRLNTLIEVPATAQVGERWRVLVIGELETIFSGDFFVTGNGQARTPCGVTYIVRPGDWLSRIADRCSTTVETLLAANPNILNASLIQPGERLVLPGGAEAAQPLVRISPPSGPPGVDVAVNASGFTPSTQVTVGIGRANTEPTSSITAVTNELGALETSIAVPQTAAAGESWVVLVSGPEASALSNPYMVTTNDVTATPLYNLRLRAGPSTDTEVLDVIPVGTTLPVLAASEAGDWVQVIFDGQVGWTAAWLTDISGELAEVPSAAEG